MISRYTYLLVFSCLIAWGPQSRADETSLNVAVPYIQNLLERDEYSTWRGALVAVFDQIEQATNYKLAITVLPFPRAVAMTKSGASDLGIFIESPERNKMAVPLRSLTDIKWVLVSLRSAKIKTINDAKLKKIGLSAKGGSQHVLEKYDVTETLTFKSHEDLMNNLLAGKVDAIITPDFRFVEMVQNAKIDYSLFSTPLILDSSPLMLYGSKNFAIHTAAIKKIHDLPPLSLNNFGIDVLQKHFPDMQ